MIKFMTLMKSHKPVVLVSSSSGLFRNNGHITVESSELHPQVDYA